MDNITIAICLIQNSVEHLDLVLTHFLVDAIDCRPLDYHICLILGFAMHHWVLGFDQAMVIWQLAFHHSSKIGD